MYMLHRVMIQFRYYQLAWISPFVIYSAIFLSPVPNMHKVDAMIFAPRPPTVLMLGCDS